MELHFNNYRSLTAIKNLTTLLACLRCQGWCEGYAALPARLRAVGRDALENLKLTLILAGHGCVY